MNDTEVVSAIRALLVEKLGAERCELWFGLNTRLCLSDGKLVVEAATKFAQDWMRTHYRGQLEAAGSAILAKPTAIEFRIDASLDCAKRHAQHHAATVPLGSRPTAQARLRQC